MARRSDARCGQSESFQCEQQNHVLLQKSSQETWSSCWTGRYLKTKFFFATGGRMHLELQIAIILKETFWSVTPLISFVCHTCPTGFILLVSVVTLNPLRKWMYTWRPGLEQRRAFQKIETSKKGSKSIRSVHFTALGKPELRAQRKLEWSTFSCFILCCSRSPWNTRQERTLLGNYSIWSDFSQSVVPLTSNGWKSWRICLTKNRTNLKNLLSSETNVWVSPTGRLSVLFFNVGL